MACRVGFYRRCRNVLVELSHWIQCLDVSRRDFPREVPLGKSRIQVQAVLSKHLTGDPILVV